MPDENKELLTAAAAFAAVGFFARAVRFAREHGHERFNVIKFAINTGSAALVSVLIGWALDGLGVSRELTLAAVGAVGYVGGPVLDLLYDEILETIKMLCDRVQSQI